MPVRPNTAACARRTRRPKCPNSCRARLPLIILVPTALFPLPFIALNMCSGSGDVFSEKPAGWHWAEFATAFLFTGCFAVPTLLAITESIDVRAAVMSLAGTLLLCVTRGVWLHYKHKESSDATFSM